MEIFSDRMETKAFSLFFLTDIHEGNANSNEAALRSQVKMISDVAKERDVMVILGGDIIDCIEVTDKRFTPTEISTKYALRDLKDLPKKQVDYVLANLNPISQFIKYALVGNHEESYIKEHHFDVYNYYCDALDCKKLGGFALGRINLTWKGKGMGIDLGLTHGFGGGSSKTPGWAINYVVDIFRKFDLDYAIAGHIHKLVAMPTEMMKLNKALKPEKKTRWWCVAGCYLETYTVGNASYFEGRYGELSQLGCLEIQADVGHDWRHKAITHWA